MPRINTVKRVKFELEVEDLDQHGPSDDDELEINIDRPVSAQARTSEAVSWPELKSKVIEARASTPQLSNRETQIKVQSPD